MSEPVKAPIMLDSKDVDSALFRTVLKKDVLGRLTEFCKKYQTGMKNERTGENYWDYGVGIQVLLDFYDYQTQQINTQVILEKLDQITDTLHAGPVEEEDKEESGDEDIRGEKL